MELEEHLDDSVYSEDECLSESKSKDESEQNSFDEPGEDLFGSVLWKIKEDD